MIPASALIAVLAFVNQSQLHQRSSLRSNSHAFVHQELQQQSSTFVHRELQQRTWSRGAALRAESSSKADGDGSSKGNKSKQSLTSKSQSKSATKSEESEETKEAAVKTKTVEVKVTRIKSKKNVIISSDTPSPQTGSTNEDPSSSPSIQGLLPTKTFNQSCHIHCTLTLLQKHFPTLLELPALSQSTAQWIYESKITVTGPRGEQLAEGLEEVLLLNRALATAATAAKRAGSLLDLAVGSSASSASSRDSSSSTLNQGKLECELLVDPNNPLKAMALWRTRLPSISSPFGSQDEASPSAPYTEFSGRSTVDLCPDTGLVTNLQINKVKVNGVAIVESLGTALAAVRRAAKSAMATQSIFDDAKSAGERRSSGNPLLDGLLSGITAGIQDVVDAVDSLPSSSDTEDGMSSDSPLFVVPKSLWQGAVYPVEDGIVSNVTSENVDINATSNASTESNENQIVYIPVPIDEYSGRIPLAGSDAFVEYALCHTSLQNFAKYGLHQLAGMHTAADSEESADDNDVSTEKVRALFTTDAELGTFGSTSGTKDKKDYITLLCGAGKVADLYRSLALFREASGGDWDVQSLETDLENQQVVVSWSSHSPLQIEGTDLFSFEKPSLASASNRLPLSTDGNKDELAARCSKYFDEASDGDIPLKIKRIENLRLTVGGVNADSAWAQSFVSAALRSGFTDNAPLPDATIQELLRALTKNNSPKNKKSGARKEKPSDVSSMPVLDDAAAVSFYGILRTLHSELPNLATLTTTPAGEYLADNVELRGLLGERIAEGSQNYNRLLGLATSSLRAAIKTNSLRLAAQPKPSLEITDKGSIKVNLILALWVTPTLPLGQPNGGNQQGFGAPLKIEVSSEYIVDKEGKISEHRIIESRLNGVLTPGDMFSRWIKGLAGEGDEDKSNAGPSAIDSFMDAITWVRSMQQGRK